MVKTSLRVKGNGHAFLSLLDSTWGRWEEELVRPGPFEPSSMLLLQTFGVGDSSAFLLENAELRLSALFVLCLILSQKEHLLRYSDTQRSKSRAHGE